jgi:hypothetical protein
LPIAPLLFAMCDENVVVVSRALTFGMGEKLVEFK